MVERIQVCAPPRGFCCVCRSAGDAVVAVAGSSAVTPRVAGQKRHPFPPPSTAVRRDFPIGDRDFPITNRDFPIAWIDFLRIFVVSFGGMHGQRCPAKMPSDGVWDYGRHRPPTPFAFALSVFYNLHFRYPIIILREFADSGRRSLFICFTH